MEYRIEGLSQADVLLIGEALDLLPHGRVVSLYRRIQEQITMQDVAERDRIADETAAIESLREIRKLPPRSRRNSGDD